MGTIIHGTLLPYDLIEAFTAELEDRNLDGFHAGLIQESNIALQYGVDAINYPDDPDQADYFSGLVCDLMDALNDVAPEGCYFGAIEGDGSDFGFWKLEGDYVA